MSHNLKVMVVDDTITYRMILKKVVESIPGMDVSAASSNGKLALGKMESDRPDVLLLDVEMPEMDGLTTLQHVKAKYPQVTVVMVSGLSRSNANIVMECLNAGALDFVTKPLETNADRAFQALRTDLEPILTLVTKKSLRQPTPSHAPPPFTPFAPFAPAPQAAPPAPPAPPRPAPVGRPPKPDLILIGSSTGGPAALTKVLGALTRRLPVPMLIVQHMPPVFTASLATQLSRASPTEVQEAQEGMPVLPGKALLAQGGKHMVLAHKDGLRVLLNEGPKVNECRPAVDVLFMSAATFQGNILTIILTGMGKDGAKGVEALKRVGNKSTYCLTQDKESCVVYGMPRAVDEMGLSDESLPLDGIGQRLLDICS